MAVPVLETERLLLRAHRVEDFLSCLAMWSDMTVVKFITGKPATPQEVWARLLRYAGHWQFLGYGYLLALDKTSGLVVGEFGIAQYHRDAELAVGEPPEAGWALLPQYHGQGLAHEAMVAMLEWAASQGIGETICRIDPANAASLLLAEKLGYVRFGEISNDEYASVLLRRTERVSK